MHFLSMLSNWRNRFESQSVSSMCYSIGALLLFINIGFIVYEPMNPNFYIVAVFVVYGCFGLGFVLRTIEILTKAWVHRWFRVLFVLTQPVVYLVAVATAKICISSAIGLPVKDFDFTVNALTLLLILPVWIALWVALSIAFILVRFVVYVFVDALIMNGVLQRPAEESRDKPDWFGDLIGAGSIGTLVNALGLLIFFAPTSFNAASPYPPHKLIRLIAYVGDYHLASAYPISSDGKKSHFHENGVISFATLNGTDVKITTEHFDDLKPKKKTQ